MTDIAKLPRHVAIIMDGNGRWATKRGLPRVEGHRKATEVVRAIIEASQEIGVEVLTLYTFSEENWNRPKDEVGALMSLLAEFLKSEFPRMMKERICLHAVGNLSLLPGLARTALQETIRLTKDNDGMKLVLALSYSARGEIVEAVREIAKLVADKEVSPEQIDEDMLAGHLYTRSLPDPDLMIRTSGEMRISNFLLFQAAYTELYFTRTLWPDFTKEEFLAALRDYSKRERRYGMTSEQLAEN
jgi:undecaprenyl diphosphate synthase